MLVTGAALRRAKFDGYRFRVPVYELHFLCETSFGISDSRGACDNRLRAETDPSLGFRGSASAHDPTAADDTRNQRPTRARRNGESATRRICHPGVASCQL